MSQGTPEWTLRRRLLHTGLIAGVVTALLAALTATALVRSANRTNDLVDRVGPTRTASFQIEAALLDQETGVRGYALTGQIEFLAPYRSGLAAAKQYLVHASQQFGDRPALRREVAQVQTLAEVWRRQYAEPAIAATQAHRALPHTHNDLGKRLFDQIRAALGKFQADLTLLRTSLYGDLREANRTLRIVALAALLAALTAAATLWQALRRWVLAPLATIGAQTRQVMGGALTHRVTVSGPQEITRLADDVDAMRGSLVAQTLRLEAQTDDLRRSNIELEQFAYVASHDLQEPLRKVASFCQMLSRRYSDQLDERGQQYIDFAVDGAKRMQQLINDLLAFSRVGRTTGEFEEIPLDGVLDRALTSLGSAIEESGAIIQAAALPVVEGSSVLLTQVFQNLIGNAIKFHGATTPRIQISVERTDDHYEFACSDNGIGIEPQYAERVFVIFQRLHGKEQYDGTGIGLAMCRKIIEHHGGRIWVDTGAAEDAEASSGTTFRWTLPIPSAAETVTVPARSERDA